MSGSGTIVGNGTRLWESFLSGDRQAFNQLIVYFYNDIFNYGLKIHHDQEFIKDLIQDLFVDLWNKRERLTSVKAVKPYLLKSIRNKIYRAISKNKEQKDFELLSEQEMPIQLPYEFHLIDKEKEDEVVVVIRNSLNTLSKRQREIIYLRFYQNLTYQQIEEIMDITNPAIRNLISKTLKILKREFELKSISFSAALLVLPAVLKQL
jgi:RNA polymerase sigma factor (sigma-70 family)